MNQNHDHVKSCAEPLETEAETRVMEIVHAADRGDDNEYGQKAAQLIIWLRGKLAPQSSCPHFINKREQERCVACKTP